MSEQGSRSRWSLLVLGIIGLPWAALGCESRAAEAASGPGAAAVGAQPVQTERVVQHMTPTPVSPGAAEGGARANRDPRAEVVSSGVGAVRSPQPITSRHLEAELNRLEAELAN